MTETIKADVAVIGGGPAGLVCAIALAAAGVETALIAPQAEPDHRTTALLAGSVTALQTLDVWPACLPHAAPLRQIRIVDDTARLLRAPEICFAAAEIGLDAFGSNIENRHLLAALEARAGELKLVRIAAAALAVKSDDEGVTVTFPDGQARVRLAIGADGARSLCRAAAGIGVTRRTYPQAALTLNLAHARPHGDVSTEFHTQSGPFTLVPLPGCRSSLVCVLTPQDGQRLAAMSDAMLAEDIERSAHSLLGRMDVEQGRGFFPLAVQSAQSLARGRIALVGEAAHVVPPIGAQGLNLGLRDGAAIAETVADAQRANRDVGAPDVLARYAAARRADVLSRTLAVDLLNRSLLADFIPVQGLRGFSLYLFDRIGPLRRALMREGVAPAASQPRLMRGEMV
ncbi:MAG TPA: UbiH/UbiF family hydroxylase [Xanthobacteraceae bacterium]|nr:UbiH/UbiF family hydroxylase [Xanthobacteraceae bacterium]